MSSEWSQSFLARRPSEQKTRKRTSGVCASETGELLCFACACACVCVCARATRAFHCTRLPPQLWPVQPKAQAHGERRPPPIKRLSLVARRLCSGERRSVSQLTRGILPLARGARELAQIQDWPSACKTTAQPLLLFFFFVPTLFCPFTRAHNRRNCWSAGAMRSVHHQHRHHHHHHHRRRQQQQQQQQQQCSLAASNRERPGALQFGFQSGVCSGLAEAAGDARLARVSRLAPVRRRRLARPLGCTGRGRRPIVFKERRAAERAAE